MDYTPNANGQPAASTGPSGDDDLAAFIEDAMETTVDFATVPFDLPCNLAKSVTVA